MLFIPYIKQCLVNLWSWSKMLQLIIKNVSSSKSNKKNFLRPYTLTYFCPSKNLRKPLFIYESILIKIYMDLTFLLRMKVLLHLTKKYDTLLLMYISTYWNNFSSRGSKVMFDLSKSFSQLYLEIYGERKKNPIWTP